MTFLPEDYSQPEQKSNYLKFKKDWDTEFRILSDSITGYIYFNKDNKPQRSKELPDESVWNEEAKSNDKWELDKIKHFRAFSVWDYATKNVCILEITQQTIQSAIMAYYKNVKRGDPKEYDLTVTRKGEGLKTEYTVIANPKEILTEEISWACLDTKINLEKLYSGEDPFIK